MSQSVGFLDSVPCPACKQSNDFRSIHQDLGGGYGMSGLEVGTRVSCDHCGHVSTVTGVFREPYITLGAGEKRTAGPNSAVQCPHCNKHQDFRAAMQTLGDSFEKGVVTECDHCGQKSRVLLVDKRTRVRVAP